ncbi:MAG: TolC family protein [Bryobacteraceae bacterium]|jgi:outer membrane protein TolC
MPKFRFTSLSTPVLRLLPLCLLTSVPCLQLPGQSPDFHNSPRVHELIRGGNLYLSQADALALAIENNLDVELDRFSFQIADTDVKRAQGGGLLRGIPFQIAEAPTGVGGPLSPVVTNPASATSVLTGTTVSTNALELGALGEPITNLSIQGTIPQSTGTPVPIFDPAVVGQLNWMHQSTPELDVQSYGVPALVANGFNANAGLMDAFASGTQVNVTFDNTHQNLNATDTNYNPYTGSSLGVTVTQPLLRGFGPALNRRFIRIANNDRKINTLLFHQQLIATVYGVIRLYTDFVALYEDVKVKQETVAAAEKLFSDTKAQVDEGTLAPVEMTRANAQVFATRQDLINARGVLEEQQAILKNLLTRTGNADPEVQAATIIPTDALDIPEKEEIRPIQDLFTEALAQRPDLGQASLQIENSQIGLRGARNATLPEVDLVGIAQNNSLAGTINGFAAPAVNTPFAGGYGTALDQLFTAKYPTYGIGVQVTIPIRNRIAEADLARDELQLKQSEVRLRQLQNEARLEVEDAVIAIRRARASYQAAVQARKYQQESLEAEQMRYEVGASTAFFVIQYESLLAQAKSTEVAAKSAYVKARAALERAIGDILAQHQISLDAGIKGRM